MTCTSAFVNPFDLIRKEESQLEEVSPELGQILNRIAKKDLLTRTKAFADLKSYIENTPFAAGLAKQFLLVWQRNIYEPLSEIRTCLLECLQVALKIYKKDFLKGVLDGIIFELLGSSWDPSGDVSQVARTCLNMIAPGERFHELTLKCKTPLEAGLQEMRQFKKKEILEKAKLLEKPDTQAISTLLDIYTLSVMNVLAVEPEPAFMKNSPAEVRSACYRLAAAHQDTHFSKVALENALKEISFKAAEEAFNLICVSKQSILPYADTLTRLDRRETAHRLQKLTGLLGREQAREFILRFEDAFEKTTGLQCLDKGTILRTLAFCYKRLEMDPSTLIEKVIKKKTLLAQDIKFSDALFLLHHQFDLQEYVNLKELNEPDLILEFIKLEICDEDKKDQLVRTTTSEGDLRALTMYVPFKKDNQLSIRNASYETFKSIYEWSHHDLSYCLPYCNLDEQFFEAVLADDKISHFLSIDEFVDFCKKRAKNPRVAMALWSERLIDELDLDDYHNLNITFLDEEHCWSLFEEHPESFKEAPNANLMKQRYCKINPTQRDIDMIKKHGVEFLRELTLDLLDAVLIAFDLPHTIYDFISVYDCDPSVKNILLLNSLELIEALKMHAQVSPLAIICEKVLKDLDSEESSGPIDFELSISHWTDLLLQREPLSVGYERLEEALRTASWIASNQIEGLVYLEEELLLKKETCNKLLSLINLAIEQGFTLRSGILSIALAKQPSSSLELTKLVKAVLLQPGIDDDFWSEKVEILKSLIPLDDSFHGRIGCRAFGALYEKFPSLDANSLFTTYLENPQKHLSRFARNWVIYNPCDIGVVAKLLDPLPLDARFIFQVLLDRHLLACAKERDYEKLIPWPKRFFESSLVSMDMLLTMAEGAREETTLYNNLYQAFREELSKQILDKVTSLILGSNADLSALAFMTVEWEESSDDEVLLACNLYYRLLRAFPTACRLWFESHADRELLESMTRDHFSKLIITRELDRIKRNRKESLESYGLNISIEQSSTQLSLSLRYQLEEIGWISLRLTIPPSFPLRQVTIESAEKDVRSRAARFTCQSILSSATFNGSLLDAITLWRQSQEKKLAGLEPCPICYCLLHPGDKSLPGPTCSTCRKKYHSSCLYRWFKSAGASTCPMCRSFF